MSIISGLGCLERLNSISAVSKSSSILIVRGQESYKASGADKFIASQLDGKVLSVFDNFQVNPTVRDVEAGCVVAEKSEIDAIVGIGGGSVMDMAKLLKACHGQAEAVEEVVIGTLPVAKNSPPLILVPTTAGSGSEATHFAVAYANEQKYSVASEALLPEAVFLDGTLIQSGSQYLRACNVLDAMAQCIESAWAKSSNSNSRKYAFAGLELLLNHLDAFLTTKPDLLACQNMLQAAHFGGRAINITKTTAPHAYSYGFTSKLKVPHGHAVWMTLPSIFEIHLQNSEEVFLDDGTPLVRVLERLAEIIQLNLADPIRLQLNKFMSRVGVKSDFSSVGADRKSMRRDLANAVNVERLKNNPIELTDSNIDSIFALN